MIGIKPTVIALAITMCAATTSPAGSIQLPQTGQTKCYDSLGTEINCTGTGQDGELRAGVAWTFPRTIINSDGTITDTFTGLIWSRNAQVATGLSWQQAVDYVIALNDQKYLGHNDWRLPNVVELRSLTNFQSSGSGDVWLSTLGFLNTKYGSWWSSTSSANNPASAWLVDMSGQHMIVGKTLLRSVLPVRTNAEISGTIRLPKTGQTSCYDNLGLTDCAGTGQDGDLQMGEPWPYPRFTVNDQTISDNLTGLMWSKTSTPDVADPWNYRMTWQNAIDYVKLLNAQIYLGYSDWRLPNIYELDSLNDMSQPNLGLWLRSQGFPPVWDTYWSSTSVVTTGYTNYAYSFSSAGSVMARAKDQLIFMRPVRGGRISIGKLEINPRAINFGEQENGTRSNSPQVISLSNSGNYDLKISQITVMDSQNFLLNVSGPQPCNSIDTTIAPGDFCTFGISFTPSILGTLSSYITISSNESSSPKVVQVSGVGINHPSISINNFAQKSQINSKRDAYFDIFIENTGGEPFTNVDVRDEQCDHFSEIDHVGDNVFDPGEKWHYRCIKYKVIYDQVNTATVKATTSTGVSRTGYAVATVKVDHAAQCDPTLYTNLCDQKGQLVTGSYTLSKKELETFKCKPGAKEEDLKNGDRVCSETVVVGEESTGCLGRCGPGCNDSIFSWNIQERYTQECLNHDLCVRATDKNSAPWNGGGPCEDEFNDAEEGYTICGPTCP
ncbi:Lcl domain-containing protein [Geomonas azotofigens]|uniref:Lcl domain-containing protein n=1 Tax=Geomonas azotofigens TaxID=2843196 RepID=UPI001C11C722|nr:DUF1566 domain-containing protein [Geomonas azotofigens]MBU5612669.1 DUF1566 domain-containing protein [Geomonas azotofigens]